MTRRSLAAFTVFAAATVLAGCGAEPTSAPQPQAFIPQGPSAALQAQTITFPPFPERIEVGGRIGLRATATSGLPVTYLTSESVCKLEDDPDSDFPLLRFIAVGFCSVTALQFGNSDWAQADPQHESIMVERRPQFIRFLSNPPSPADVGGTYVMEASDGISGNPVTFSSLSPVVCTVSGNTATFIAEGFCTVAADQAGDAIYDPADQETQQFMVGKFTQAIAFTSTPPNPALVGGTYSVTATGGGSGIAVAFSSLTTGACTVSGNTVTFVAALSCTVAANQTGNASYKPAPQVTQQFTVAKVPQSIQFTSAPPNPAFATETYAVTATGGGSNNTIAFSSLTMSVCTVSGTTVTFIGSGACSVAADQPGNDGFLAAPQQKQDFTVFKRNQKVLFTDQRSNALVNDTYTPAATATSGLVPVTFSVRPAAVCTISGGLVKFVGVGICEISGTQAGDAAFNPITVSFNVTVAYGFQGFASPVNNDGALNVAKPGQAIPLKWRLVDGAGLPITNLSSATITVKELACAVGSAADQVEEYASGGSGLQNLGDGYYQMNWKSPATYKGSCKSLTLALGDGGTHTALFQFTK